MKSWKIRLGAVSASALLAASVAVPAPAFAQEKTTAATTVDKDETVYAYTSPVGYVRDISVRDLLANEQGEAALNDKSSLADIEITSDDAKLQSQKGDELVWSTQGKEVQYKGSSSSDLPLTVRISYTLNGKIVTPAELAGATGHVAIRIEYQNNDERTIEVDGKDTKVYTPFVAMSTVNLDRDVFSHIAVTNGRIIDGSGSVSVIGYAMPGLQESLELDTEDIEIPTYVLIEADAKDFSLGSITTIATPELFANMDTSDFDVSDLTDARDELSDAMGELVNGTSELASGMQQLAEGQQNLSSGLDQLSSMTDALPKSASTLAEGASGLKEGLSSAKEGAGQLAAGAAAVAEGIAGAQAQLAIATQDLGTLAGGMATVQSGIAEQVAALEALRDELKETEGVTEEQIQAIEGAIAALQAVALPDPTDAATGLAIAQGIVDKTAEGAAGVSEGAQGVAEGLGKLYEGASQLHKGISAFSDSMPKLVQGVSSLAQGANQLSTATNAAAEGTEALASGVRTFDEDGIQELVNKLDESGIASMGSRLDALSQAADDYQSFSGIASGQTGSVKFIIKADSIGE